MVYINSNHPLTIKNEPVAITYYKFIVSYFFYFVNVLDSVLNTPNIWILIFTFVSKSQTIVDSAVLCEIAIKNVDDNLFSLEPFYLSIPQAERMRASASV